MVTKEVETILNKITEIQDYKYYCSPAMAMFDTVMSINTRYQTVKNILPRFEKAFNFTTALTIEMPDENEQIKSSVILESLKKYTPQQIADILQYQGKSNAGNLRRLKTDIFMDCLNILKSHKIETFQDVNCLSETNRCELDKDLRNVKGINDKITYIFMLCGEKDFVMVDRHIRKFVKETLQLNLSDDKIAYVLKQTAREIILPNGQQMTPRLLDHCIWNYMHK